MKKIIKLTESDLSRIIDRVLNETSKKRNVLSEQKLNSDGTYTLMGDHYFEATGVSLKNNIPYPQIRVKKGATVETGGSDDSVFFRIYGSYDNGSTVSWKDMGEIGKLKCGDDFIQTLRHPSGWFIWNGDFWKFDRETMAFNSLEDKISIKPGKNDISYYAMDLKNQGGTKSQKFIQTSPEGMPFTKTLNKLFCDGQKLKSKDNIGGGGQESKTDSRCKSVEKEFKNQEVCFLPDDKVWMYAKTDDGKWYTTKQTDKKTWCELTAPKFQKAIDVLVAGCKGLQPVPELKIKKLEPIDTSTEDMVLKKTDQQKKEFEDKMKNLPQ